MAYPYDVDPRVLGELQREREIRKAIEEKDLRARVERLERALMQNERQSRMTTDQRAGTGAPAPTPAPTERVSKGVSQARALSRLATGLSVPAYFAIQAYADDPAMREMYLDRLSAAASLAHVPALLEDTSALVRGEPVASSTPEVVSRALPIAELASRHMR